MDLTFAQYVERLLKEHRGERVLPFEYQQQKFWLKQPEQLHGVWLLLKPRPAIAFNKELQILLDFNAKKLPVPPVVLQGKDFFVLQDMGVAVNKLLASETAMVTDKKQILKACIQALIALHQQGVLHGRPAVRDLLYQDGKVCFVDFEAHIAGTATDHLISRDMLIFLYSLCRESSVDNELLHYAFSVYHHLAPQRWHKMLMEVKKLRFIYVILQPFKSIAKKDLKAIYRLFVHLSSKRYVEKD